MRREEQEDQVPGSLFGEKEEKDTYQLLGNYRGSNGNL